MSKQMILDMPDNLYERVQQVAQAEREDAINVVSRLLDGALPPVYSDESHQDWYEPNEAVEREMEAYIALHPMLKERYFGKHVAVYQGQLIDVADDADTLYERIDARYPDEFVWMCQVKAEPIDTIYNRTIRLEPIN
jgi:Family of unknown function (DUF5678)